MLGPYLVLSWLRATILPRIWRNDDDNDDEAGRYPGVRSLLDNHWLGTKSGQSWRRRRRQSLPPENLGWLGQPECLHAKAVLRSGSTCVLRHRSAKVRQLGRVRSRSYQGAR